MPRVIDDRVLAMEFDNSKFEKNVNTSISTLDRLKGALSFKGTDKDFGIVETTVLELGKSFNWLEEIGVGALRRFGASIQNWAANTIKELSGVNNAIAGFKKFGEMTESTGTLKAQGYELEEINTQLDRLNWFADETSYNLTDMVGNIAKFTATGQGLEDSADAIMGIALWAALSGKNATQASSAMYQLSQALGAGVMRKEDWKSIQNLNMNTREFQQHALDAAVALETLKKNSDGTYTSLVATGNAGKEAFNIDQFAERLTEGGWFTKDVMMKVFREYSAGVQQIYDYTEEHGVIASEAIKALEGEIDEFGLKAFKAGQEARTWGAVVDSIKDAASTGWMTVYQNLFGEYDAVVEFFTNLANRFYDIFVEPINDFNEVLESWGEKGGQSDFIQAIYNIVSAIENFAWVFKHVSNEIVYGTTDADTIFGINTDTLLKVTKAVKDFTAKIADTIKYSHVFRRYLRAFLTIFDMAWQIISGFWKAIKETFHGTGKVIESVFEKLSYVARAFYSLGEYTKKNQSFYKIFSTALKPIKNLLNYLRDLYTAALPELKDRWEKLKESFKEKISPSIEKLKESLGKLKDIVVGVWEGLFGGKDAKTDADKLFATWDKVKDTFYSITRLEPGTFIDWVAGRIDKLTEKLENLNKWLTVKDTESGLTGIEKIQNAFDSAIKWIKDTFGPIWKDLKTAFEDAFSWIIEHWDSVWSTVKQIGSAIWAFFSGIWGSVSGIFSKKDGEEAGESTFTGLLNSLKTLGSLLGSILTTILSSISPLVENIVGMLGDLSLENAGEFLKGGGLALFGAGFYRWAKNFKKSNWILGFGDLLESLAGPLDSFARLLDGKALKEAAIGIGVLVAALLLLISMPQDDLLGAAIVMSMIIDILTRSLKKLSGFNTSAKIDKNGFSLSKTGAGSTILMMALSLVAIAFALRMIAKIPEDDLYRAAFVIGVMTAIIGLVIKGIVRIQNAGEKVKQKNSIATNLTVQNNVKAGLVGTLIGIAIFIGVVVWALQKVTNLVKNNPNEYKKALIIVAGIMVALGAFMLIVGKSLRSTKKGNFEKSMDDSFWLAIVALGAAVYLIALAFEKIASTKASSTRMLGAGVLIMLIMGIMIGFVAAASKIQNAGKVAGVAAGLVIFAFAIGIISVVVAALALIMDRVKDPARIYIAMGIIAAIFLGFTFIMGKWGKDLNGKKMIGAAGAIVLISVALLLAAGSLLLLAKIPSDKISGVENLLIVIFLTIGSLGLLASGRVGDGLTKLATIILMIAGAATLLGVGFLAVAEAIKIFSDSSLDVERAVNNISKVIDALVENLPEWAEKIIQTLLEVVLASIPATIKALINTASETLAALVEEDPITGKMKIESLIEDLLKVFLAIIVGIADHAEEIVNSVGRMLLEIFDGINKWLIDNAEHIGNTLAEGLQAILDVMISTVDSIGEMIFGEEEWAELKATFEKIKTWLDNNIFSWLWDQLIALFNLCTKIYSTIAEAFGIESPYVNWASGMSEWYDYYKKIAPNARNSDIWKLAQETYSAGLSIGPNGAILGLGTHTSSSGVTFGGHGYNLETGEYTGIIDTDVFNSRAKTLLENGLKTDEVDVDTKNGEVDVDAKNGKVILGSASSLEVYKPMDASISTATISVKGAQLLGSDLVPIAKALYSVTSNSNSITINNAPGKTAAEQYREAKAGLARIAAYTK